MATIDGAISPQGATTGTSIGQQPKRRRPWQQGGVAPVDGQPAAPQAQPQQPQMTFAQMQQQGYARPAPPPPAPAPVPQPAPQMQQAMSNTFGGPAATTTASTSVVNPRDSADVREATRTQLMASLQNPAGFGQDEVKQWYDRGAQDIDDQFAQEETAAREEMARRGLSDSSIMGGRLGDLNVRKRTAQVDLTDKLGRQLAEELSASRDRAINTGINFDQFLTDSQYKSDQLGLDRSKLDLDTELGRGKLGIDSSRIALDERLGLGDLNLKGDRLRLDQEIGRGELDLNRDKFGENKRQFDEDLGLNRDKFGEDRRQFDEDLRLQRDKFGQQMTNDEWQKYLDLMGVTNDTEVYNPDVMPNVGPEADPYAQWMEGIYG